MTEFYSGEDFYVEEPEYGRELEDMSLDEAMEEVSKRAYEEELDTALNDDYWDTPLEREIEDGF